MLRLEILCGSTSVDEAHPGYFSEDSFHEDFIGPVHPKHILVRDLLSAEGIHCSVQNSDQDGWYSDAYIYFEADQIDKVVDALNSAEFQGHYLDVPEGYDNEYVLRVASDNFWDIENIL